MVDPKALEQTKRQVLRDKIFGSRNRKRIVIDILGEKVELRQPSLGDLMDAREEKESKKVVARMIINYCYIPGTEERVFEDADVEAILALPFGEELVAIQNAISELTGVDVKEQEKN